MIHTISSDHSSHSFRHTLRDRLIDASVASYEVEQLAGWSSAKTMDHYGTNKALNMLHGALTQMMEHEASLLNKT